MAASRLFARSGNVDNPDRNWSPWKPVDLQNDLPIDAPSARYMQWKAVLKPGKPPASIDSVTVNYLPKNVAPEVDDVTVVPDARVPSGTHSEPEQRGSRLRAAHSHGEGPQLDRGEVEGARRQ